MITNEDDLLLNDDSLQKFLSNEKLEDSASDARAILYGNPSTFGIYYPFVN